MKFLLKLVREGLGRIIIAVDFITRPRPLKRSKPEQAKVHAQLNNLALYQFYACPFCIKTRRALRRLNLPMQTRDIADGSPYRTELEKHGGKIQAPCLRIESDGKVEWLYESKAIIAYLDNRFGVVAGHVSTSEAATS
ncbi:glutathione S-transferase N-terminal domain-containing protein [Simiduia agarivorans]|uniref:Glutaredoxin n=1 Tax=Simiduia agarivorans (strain DSM 21679 / JCM 13881 / BCRC 17597 / SA1) TaxID=1117647 RepID=K4KGM6_SIMAS|nr:glutathione S-transferase N-terminal domain-containing protein [Simiduia agarivorans]AFU98239.1 glutaredoxin [Simiduia agarivorans SA1 = DSM 21679]